MPDSLHWLDAVALGVVAWNAVFGLIRGATFQVLRLAMIGTGIVLARRYAPAFGEWLEGPLPDAADSTRLVAAWFAILVSTALVGMVLLRVMRKILAAWRLGGYDRFLGLLVGMLKGVVIVILVTLLLGAAAEPLGLRSTLDATRVAPFSAYVVERAAPIFPGTLGTDFSGWLGTRDDGGESKSK
jgi:membrane protein required for colicin V production